MQEGERDEPQIDETETADRPAEEGTQTRDLPPRRHEADEVKGGAVGPCFRPR